MLMHYLPLLNSHRLVLASASPRRKELLAQIGLRIEVQASSFEEDLDKGKYSPAGYAQATAQQKALDVDRRTRDDAVRPLLIIAADTVVEVDGDVLEKPQDVAHAVSMLQRLSGRQHQVHTGVAMVTHLPSNGGTASTDDGRWHVWSETTDVEFDALPEAAIQAYVASGEPFGKAGGYGIQAQAAQFVRSIRGDYFNVVGFPLHAFCAELAPVLEAFAAQGGFGENAQVTS